MTSIPDPTCLTPGPGHYTFGYYDRDPIDPSGRYHLALRIPQQTRLPQPGEPAMVGLIDLQHGNRFIEVAPTYAWNHQQGAMTQWIPHIPGAFVFNDAVQENGRWRLLSRVYHADSGHQRDLPLPVYHLSPDGRQAATLDFGRIYYRPGYAYPVADSTHQPNLPDDVGITIMDTTTGDHRLICSIRRIADLHPVPFDLDDDVFVWLNHPVWNRDGSRLLFLFRYEMAVKTTSRWKTFMYTIDTDGGNLISSLPHWYWQTISHQTWGRTPREVLVDANWRGLGAEFVVFTDGETVFHNATPGIAVPHAHATFSPDGRTILADSYPQGDAQLQDLRLVDVETCRDLIIGRFSHAALAGIDSNVRCDLHPRWGHHGRLITFDSVMSGERKIYAYDLADIVSATTGMG